MEFPMRLSRRLFFAAIIAALSIQPSLAAPPAGEHGAAEPTADEKEVARSVQLDGMVFPVFDAKGKLKNYLFVNARMLVGPGKDPWKYREKSHFIRDAVVRAAHRTSFAMKDDMNKLDEKLAAAECLKVANLSIGEKDALVTMTFTQIASQANE
jgi:hypothetical protein